MSRRLGNEIMAAERKLETLHDACLLLKEMGAPFRLIRHAELVSEAAELLIQRYEELGVQLNYQWIRLGAALHDCGKILYPEELEGPGNRHEPRGATLLRDHGVSEKVARCCLSHARWNEMECALEELSVALADKLWKGKRVEVLENLLIDRVAQQLNRDRWDLFIDLDNCFEEIANGGNRRLARSVGFGIEGEGDDITTKNC